MRSKVIKRTRFEVATALNGWDTAIKMTFPCCKPLILSPTSCNQIKEKKTFYKTWRKPHISQCVYACVSGVVMLIQRDPSQKTSRLPGGANRAWSDLCPTFQCCRTAEISWASEGNIWATAEVLLVLSQEKLMRIINKQVCMCLDASVV